MTTWQRVEIPMPRAESNGPGVLLLTERELRFLTMRCVWQLSTKEVAERVCRSENTVKNCLTNVYRKMGVRSIERACYELGLCNMEPGVDGLRAESV